MKTIDEVKLAMLAKEYREEYEDVDWRLGTCIDYSDLEDAFMAGYRKAMEE